jgi:uncharacterized membrane protein
MQQMWLAAGAFLALHWLVARHPVRRRIIDRLGERLYQHGFATASIVLVAWMAVAYSRARHGPGDIMLFDSPPYAPAMNAVGQLAAAVFITCGFTTSNPGTVGQGGHVNDPGIARGILRITRHPFLWGVGLFAGLHMLATPTLASWVLFGTLALVALTGTVGIDHKRARVWGQPWTRFAQETSNLPFAAIASGRQSLDLAEIGWKRWTASVAVWALLIALHP